MNESRPEVRYVSIAELTELFLIRGEELPNEVGLYLTLAVAEAAFSASPDAWMLGTDGSIRANIYQRTQLVEGGLYETLCAVLSVTENCGPEVVQTLAVGADVADLVGDVEAELVPLNRAASRRILGRLVNEFFESEGAEHELSSLPAEELASALIVADSDLEDDTSPAEAEVDASVQDDFRDVAGPFAVEDHVASAHKSEESEWRQAPIDDIDAEFEVFWAAEQARVASAQQSLES